MATTNSSLFERLGLEEIDRYQITEILADLRDVLGRDLIGVYLHGSAVLGKLRAQSDLDLLAVSARRLSREDKAQLIDHLLAVSGLYPATAPPRPVELTIVVWSEIRPWQYPPTMDFQYGEWLRGSFEHGELEPWPSRTNPDLALLATMALVGEATVVGPRPSEVFDPVPSADLVKALVADIGALIADLDRDTRNVVLTLARVWNGVETLTLRSKEAAAEWALPRLESPHRAVLARARNIYLGTEEEHWEDVQDGVRPFAAAVVAEIKAARSTFIEEPWRGVP